MFEKPNVPQTSEVQGGSCMYFVISSRNSINIFILIFSLSEFLKYTSILGVHNFLKNLITKFLVSLLMSTDQFSETSL